MNGKNADPHQHRVSLSVSCVTFRPDSAVLLKMLKELVTSLCSRDDVNLSVYIVDNSPNGEDKPQLETIMDELDLANLVLLSGHGNLGFGGGHNLALKGVKSDFHLVINPDVYVDRDAVVTGINYLIKTPEVALVAPSARNEDGEFQYIAKRYPSFLCLLLRGGAPKLIQRAFASRLDRYEVRDLIPAPGPVEVELASGCFMLVRTKLLKAIGGFDQSYFMYFEDYDLSLRIRNAGHKIVHLPSSQIVHLGGGAARKGLTHIKYFLVSAVKFFNRHGWKFV